LRATMQLNLSITALQGQVSKVTKTALQGQSVKSNNVTNPVGNNAISDYIEPGKIETINLNNNTKNLIQCLTQQNKKCQENGDDKEELTTYVIM